MSTDATRQHWASYLTNVNHKLASILLDLELRPKAPDAQRPHLLWVWLKMNASRPDGLSDSVEAPLLYDIEDVLVPALSASNGAILAGRITTQNRREFYFYATHATGFSNTTATALLDFPNYKYQANSQPDPAWQQYLDVLYPSPEQLQCIANADVLRSLKSQGDDLSIPRPVDHWVLFPTATQRLDFRRAVRQAGDDVAEESEPNGEAFAISVVRIQSVEQSAIDRSVLELFAIATRHGGSYDGWGCNAQVSGA